MEYHTLWNNQREKTLIIFGIHTLSNCFIIDLFLNRKALDLELLKQIKDKILSEDNRLEECDKSLKDVEAKYKDKRTHCETLQKELENLKSNPLEDEHNRMKALKEELKSILQEVNTLKTLSTTIKSVSADSQQWISNL